MFTLISVILLCASVSNANRKVNLDIFKYGKENLIAGDECAFNCAFRSFGKLIEKDDFKLKRNGVDVLASQHHLISNILKLPDWSEYQVSISKLSLEDDGVYRCVYTADDIQSEPIVLKVWPSFEDPLCIYKEFYFVGDTITLSCQAYSYDSLKILWTPTIGVSTTSVQGSVTTEEVSFEAQESTGAIPYVCHYYAFGRRNEIFSCAFDFFIKQRLNVSIVEMTSRFVVGSAAEFQCVAPSDVDLWYNWTLKTISLVEMRFQTFENVLIIEDVTDEINGGSLSCTAVGDNAEGSSTVILNLNQIPPTSMLTMTEKILTETTLTELETSGYENLTSKRSKPQVLKIQETLILVGCASLGFTVLVLIILCIIMKKKQSRNKLRKLKPANKHVSDDSKKEANLWTNSQAVNVKTQHGRATTASPAKMKHPST